MPPCRCFERTLIARTSSRFFRGSIPPANLLLGLLVIGSLICASGQSDSSGLPGAADCNTPACRAALPPSGPFLQLQSTKFNFFEQAYQASFGEGASGNISYTLHHVDNLLAWVGLCKGQDMSLTGTNCTTTEAAQLQELLSGSGSQELLQVAMQLAQPDISLSTMTSLMMQIGAHLMQIPDNDSHPAMRRLLLGTLLKQRSMHGPFTGVQRILADTILLQFYLMHRRSAAHKGAIQYFHVSKSGGTNMCQTAGDNGCSAEGFDESSNCKVRAFLDWPRWLTRTGHADLAATMQKQHGNRTTHSVTGSQQLSRRLRPSGHAADGDSSQGGPYMRFKRGRSRTLSRQALMSDKRPWFINFEHKQQLMDCAHRAAHLKRRGFNFYAVEYAVPKGSPCGQFLQLMLWRDPMERMKSHINYVQTLYAHTYKLADVDALFSDRNASFWRMFLPVGTDNQYIRSLLGAQMWQLPLKPVTEQHMRTAMLQVLQQDVLLILEHRDLTDLACRQGLGWQSPLRTQKVRASGLFRAQLYLPQDWTDLQRLNQPDMQVYEFASHLAAVDALLWHGAQSMRKELNLDMALPTTLQCGYVSLPVTLLQSSGTQSNSTAGATSSSQVGQ